MVVVVEVVEVVLVVEVVPMTDMIRFEGGEKRKRYLLWMLSRLSKSWK